MTHPAIENLQKSIELKRDSYNHTLKVYNRHKAHATAETKELQRLQKEINSFEQAIQLISDAEKLNDTMEKNAPASATSPTVPGDFGLAINVIEGKDALKILENLL